MLLFKAGVKLKGVQPETLLGMQLAEQIFQERGYGPLTITSVMDGIHMEGSLHYKGLAFDVRIWTIPPNKLEEVITFLKLVLGPLGFQVVSEANHLHLEFDPT